MNDRDRLAAGNALIDWFQSQDIQPAEASFIMLKVMARQLVRKNTEHEELMIAIMATTRLLTLEVADELKKVQ